jgi:hypothetical protein
VITRGRVRFLLEVLAIMGLAWFWFVFAAGQVVTYFPPVPTRP